jgi:serine/threonine protein kinase
MHSMDIYHFDVKPANIMISGARGQSAILTDMGSCIHAQHLPEQKQIRVHFTWTYAHPALTTIINEPRGITGGGLRASALIDKSDNFASYDLYAFGRTMQEALAILLNEFGVRCHASYPFRFLHMIACMLLDGFNAPGRDDDEERVHIHDGRRFVDDVALKYPPALFAMHRIRTTAELVNRLARFSREYSWNGLTPELDTSLPDVVNSGLQLVPFTKRVKVVFTHGAMRRLKHEAQLGWLREIYPGATHNRWSHSLGVFASVVAMLNALLSDPEVPTFNTQAAKGSTAIT